MARRREVAIDRASMEAAALAYVERYASTAANLRRVLMRRVRRAEAQRGAEDPVDRAALAELIDAIVARYTSARLVDDDAFARGRAASLHRRGDSLRSIQAKLRAKGVSDADARTAVDALTEGSSREAVELAAAWSVARKRRLGPFREDEAVRAERRMKDLAALLRRGFSHGVAEKVLRARLTDAPGSE